MSSFKDSVGNVYAHLPTKPPNHTAKGTTETSVRRSSRRKKGQKANSCAKYRARVGKPNGPGEAGQHKH